jgi:hydroxymethylpyrimidine pyrophosphatase-like HAD family hydrolase
MSDVSDPIRLIAIDLDGTLLNSQRGTTPRTERAIQAARDRGTAVCLATGRPFFTAAKWPGT